MKVAAHGMALWAALLLAGTEFIQLTAPGGQKLELNLSSIVAIRIPRNPEHFSPGGSGKCIVHTTDGKYIVVVETCDRVDEIIKAKLGR